MNKFSCILISGITALYALSSDGHSGRTDANGGHYDRKNGGYHYHSSPKAAPAPTTTTHVPPPKTQSTESKSAEKACWLNTDSNVRHNNSCRYYMNTKQGRAATKSEGKACGICGG